MNFKASRCAAIAATLLFGSAVVSPAQAGSNLLIVLDASNSMWGQIEGTAKIETAKTVLGDLVTTLPETVSPGLMVYGHRSEGDCSDVELVAPFGTGGRDQIVNSVNGLTPRGKTPIAASLREAWDAFSGREEDNNAVVLISDGIETCDDDPCAVAAELTERGVNVRIHAVGFDVDAEAAAQLECIAETGGGLFFTADNAEGLREAVQLAQQTVVEPEPAPAPEPAPPPQPTSETVFFDDFEGTDLSEDWVVDNRDPNSFIVENSELLVINSGLGLPQTEGSPNRFILKRELPNGDFDAIATLTGEFKTGRDTFWFGLWTDPQNYLGAQFFTKRDCCGCSNIVLRNVKVSGGESTMFDVGVLGSGIGCGSFSEPGLDAAMAPRAETPFKVGLHKRGRNYNVSIDFGELDDAGNPLVYETDVLTSLRLPGELTIVAGKWDDRAQGELLLLIDSVEVNSVSQ